MDEEFAVTIRLRVHDDTGQPLRSAEQRLSTFTKSVDQAQRSVARLSSTQTNVRLALQDKLSAPLKTLQAGLSKLIAKPYNVVVGIAQKGGDLVKGIAGKIGGALSGIAGAAFSPISAALAGVASVGAVIGAGGKGLGLAGDLQQTTIAFELMLGSAERAQTMLTDLQRFAAQTPFEMPEIRDAARQLLAYGFAAEDLMGMLTPIGDTVSGLGGTFQNEGQRIIRALGQMRARGKITSEELMQLQEIGISALPILAQGFGKTTAEMQDMISDGLVPAEEGISLLIEGMGRQFPNMMARQSRTLDGLKSTLMDTFNTGLLLRFGQGLAGEIQPRLERVVDWLANNEATVTAWGDALFQAGSVIANVVLSGMELLIKAGQALAPVIEAIGGGLAVFMAKAGDNATLSALQQALGNLAQAGRELWDVISPLLLPVLEVLLNLLGVLLVGAVHVLAQVLLALSERILKAVQDFTAFVELVKTVWSWLSEKLAPAFDAVGSAAQRVLDIVTGLVDGFKRATEAVGGFMEKAGGIAGAVGGAVGGAAGAVGAAMTGPTELGPQAQAAAQSAISKGMSHLGSQAFVNYCLKFVDDMFGATKRYGTAWQAAQAKATTVGGSLADVPAGMAAYFRADPSNQGAGHVMISQGGGKFLDPSYKGVRTTQAGDELWDYYSKLYYGYGPGGDLNAQSMKMAGGGILSEPIMGMGMRTGTPYTLAENGPEAVTPLGGTKSGGTQHVTIGSISVSTGSGDPVDIREAVVAGVLDALAEAYETVAPNVR